MSHLSTWRMLQTESAELPREAAQTTEVGAVDGDIPASVTGSIRSTDHPTTSGFRDHMLCQAFRSSSVGLTSLRRSMCPGC
jgi:hypothetical protein